MSLEIQDQGKKRRWPTPGTGTANRSEMHAGEQLRHHFAIATPADHHGRAIRGKPAGIRKYGQDSLMPDGDNSPLPEGKTLQKRGVTCNGQFAEEEVKAEQIVKLANKAMVDCKKREILEHSNLVAAVPCEDEAFSLGFFLRRRNCFPPTPCFRDGLGDGPKPLFL